MTAFPLTACAAKRAGEPTEKPPLALFIGDSYSAGAGASMPSNRWTTLAADTLGWGERNAALGGTGYRATATHNGCGRAYCASYLEVVQQEAVNADVVVISGGRNDSTEGDEFRGAVDDVFTQAILRYPAAQIAVTSLIWDDDAMPSQVAEKRDIVAAEAHEHGLRYVDLGEPLEGHPERVAPDGVHPNDAGHAAIASAFVAAWEKAEADAGH